GSSHPEMAVVATNLGAIAETAGQLAEADAAYERAIEIWQRSYGADHPVAASAWAGRGRTALRREDLVAADRAYTHAHALATRAGGIAGIDVAEIEIGWAGVLLR